MTSARLAGAGGLGSGWARSDECGLLLDSAVAIDAIDFDRGARFSVNFAVAMIVLSEMAIGTLQSFFEVDVGKVDGFLETLRIIEGDRNAVFVEPVPFSIVIEDGAKNPAMAMEISELGGFELLVEFA